MGNTKKMRGVSPKIYTREYYLTINDGGALGKQDMQLSPRLAFMVNLAHITSQDTVLDVGCGSGEFCLHVAKKAKRVVGIDYSSDAIQLATEYLGKMPLSVQKKTTFAAASVHDIEKKLGKQKFTKIFMNDVVEHLYPEELEKTLKVLRGLLTQDGVLYIHTAPNLDFYTYGYPVLRFLYPVIRYVPGVQSIIDTKPNWKGRRRLPKDPEEGSHNKEGHVNEQTGKSMKDVLETCGFTAKVRTLPFLRDVRGVKIRLLYVLLSIPPLKQMFSAEIVAEARL